MEDTTKLSCRAFADLLSSASPAPGGGGASALVGALAASLGSMVANLTLGKKSYESVEAEMQACKAQCENLRDALLDLVRADAECFLPLAASYAMAKDDPNRAQNLENALETACTAPLAIMGQCRNVIDLSARLEKIGSRLALSDVGCCASLAKAALESASLNIFINTKSMQNRAKAAALESRAAELLKSGEKAARVFESVQCALKGEP